MSYDEGFKFALIIPVFQTPQILEVFLNSLYKTITYPSKIIFINDGSSESTSRLLNNFNAPSKCSVEIIYHSYSLGCARSINEALELLDDKQEYVVFLDSDLILQSGWQYEISQSLKNEKIGIVGGVLVYPQTGGIQCCGISFNLNSCKHLYLNSYPDVLKYKGNFEIQSTVFAFCAIRKKAINEVGGMDELFYNGYEDLDLQMRIRKLGYTAICNVNILLYHWEKSNGPHRTINKKRNLGRLWYKHGNFIYDDLSKYMFERIDMISTHITSEYYCIDLCEDRSSAEWLIKELSKYKNNFIKNHTDYSYLCNSQMVWLPEVLDSTCIYKKEPLLFLCDNFISLSENHYWWQLRASHGAHDIIIDLYGNAVLFSDITNSFWPGRKIR